MSEDKKSFASLADAIGLQLEDVPMHPRPIRGRREVTNLKPGLVGIPAVQEVPETGDKKDEGEHTVLPTPTQEPIMTQTNPNQQYRSPVDSETREQARTRAMHAAAADADAAWNQKDMQKAFLASVQNDINTYKFITESDLPSAVKKKLYKNAEFERGADIGTRIAEGSVKVAVVALSAVAVVASVVVIAQLIAGPAMPPVEPAAG